MKNKGFTLIELLAVIVILAVIALIAYPVITGIVENSKKNSALRSIEGYVEAANNATVIYDVDNNKGINVTTDKHTFTSDVDTLDFSKIKVKGTIPTYSYIDFNTKTKAVKEGHFCINGYSVIYENNQAKISNTNYCTDNHDSGDNEEIGNGGNQGNDDPEPIVEEDPKELVLYENGTIYNSDKFGGIAFYTWGTASNGTPLASINSGYLKLETRTDNGANAYNTVAFDMSKYKRFCFTTAFSASVVSRSMGISYSGWITLGTKPLRSGNGQDMAHEQGRLLSQAILHDTGWASRTSKFNIPSGATYFGLQSADGQTMYYSKIWLERD